MLTGSTVSSTGCPSKSPTPSPFSAEPGEGSRSLAHRHGASRGTCQLPAGATHQDSQGERDEAHPASHGVAVVRVGLERQEASVTGPAVREDPGPERRPNGQGSRSARPGWDSRHSTRGPKARDRHRSPKQDRPMTPGGRPAPARLEEICSTTHCVPGPDPTVTARRVFLWAGQQPRLRMEVTGQSLHS